MSFLNWRNPEKELPTDGQRVWVMLEPHKDRGSLFASAMSIEVCCGEVSWCNEGVECRVFNVDELGLGDISWVLRGELDGYDTRAIAWLPVDEMPLPKF